ncbi:MAG: PilZ domain-containing protein [Gemmatimonadaceae bacterium]
MRRLSTSATTHPGSQNGPARLSPYATALLARERAVLLEWSSPTGKRTRRRGRLCAGTRRGGTLTVELTAAEPAERPVPGSGVTLVVPAQNALWRFGTVTAVGMEDTGAVSLAWPVEVCQEAGRRFGRAHCMLPLSVTAGDNGEGRALCTYTLDVSMGGVQMATPTPLPIGASLRLSIRLPKETVTAAATVAWSRALRDEPGDPMYTAGLRFVSLTPRAATRLRTLLGMSGVTAS